MVHSHTTDRAFLFLLCLISAAPTPSSPFEYRRGALDPISETSSDNVQCFLDYMELWVPRRQIDGLIVWLSRIMRFPVSLSSLDRTNHMLSRCRYILDTDSDGNFIFRVHYSACSVQKENGFHILDIHMVTKTSLGKGKSDRYHMKCPAMAASLGREKVLCDPHYVQVSRPMPIGNTNDQVHWFLSFRGEFVVSLEDSSLIGVEVEMSNSSVTVRGLRGQLLYTKEFMSRPADVLPLWLAHGFYAYSLEASCPPVSQHPGEEIVLHIPKQRVGLVKRGSYNTEKLTLRNIVVRQSINITLTEDKHFVVISVPAAEVLQAKLCRTTQGNRPGVQLFYSIELVLEFTEMVYTMNWTMENYYECAVDSSYVTQPEHIVLPKAEDKAELSVNVTASDIYPVKQAMKPSVQDTTAQNNPTGSPSLERLGVSLLEKLVTVQNVYTETPAPDFVLSTRARVSRVPSKVGMATLWPSGGADIVASGDDINVSGSGDSIESAPDLLQLTARTKPSSTLFKLPNSPTPQSYVSNSVHRQHVFSSLLKSQQTNMSALHNMLTSQLNKPQYSKGPSFILSNSSVSDEQQIKHQLPVRSNQYSGIASLEPLLQVSEKNKTSPNSLKYRLNVVSSSEAHVSTTLPITSLQENGDWVGTKNKPGALYERHNTISKLRKPQVSNYPSPTLTTITSSHTKSDASSRPMNTESEFLDGTFISGFMPFISRNVASNRNNENVFIEQVNSRVAAGTNMAEQEEPTDESDHRQYIFSVPRSSDLYLQDSPPSSDQLSPPSMFSLISIHWPLTPESHVDEEKTMDDSPERPERILANEQLILSAANNDEHL